jgi:hypothetical protein
MKFVMVVLTGVLTGGAILAPGRFHDHGEKVEKGWIFPVG